MGDGDSTGRIELRGMRFLGRHGVTLAERIEPQPFEVDLLLHGDLTRPVASDELADTADYSELYEVVREAVEEESFRLVEALAGAILERVRARLAPDGPVDRVEVRVRKPAAPLSGPFDTVEVVLARPR
ncbi:MAG TPA: dihydroneopterin aldolase [Candidatus Limnocylindria bacterium]|nr:dihydroneopterin aldolase [Candidatus Limnocylindria bacterium]